MITRNQTSEVKVGNIIIGGNNLVKIQSMCDIKTSNVSEIIKQINRCTLLGADLMRVSILDESDAKAIKEIKKGISIPLVADIHFDYKLALLAIENGADKIRINPGNFGSDEKLDELIKCATKYNVAIRIGVNSGSLEKEFQDNTLISDEDKMVSSALKYIEKFEKRDFYNLIISAKASDPLKTISVYRKLAQVCKYPLHIGVTESGFDEIGIIRSVSALSPLLLDGIGSTIRISLTHNPEKEVETCVRLLHDLGLYENYPTIISCPTCGRTQVTNLSFLANETLKFLVKNKKYIKVAIMGCVVNGIGEGKNADLGLAGGKNMYAIFKKGKIIREVNEKNALNALFEEIDKF